MKPLYQAWEEVASVWTKPACSWQRTDTRLLGLHAGPDSWYSAYWWGWGGLLTSPLACGLVSATPELQEMHWNIVTLNVL